MTKKKRSLLATFLNAIEKGGNALPHPGTLFGLLALLVLLFSWVGHYFDWTVVHPATQETIHTQNLLSKDGVHHIILNLVKNYTSFAPLGIVMVALLGIGIAEASGLVSAAIRLLVSKAPAKSITFVIVLAGIISNMASDLGYLLIIPMAGVIFHSLGRHPIAGMAAAFAGVSGGFSANLFIGTIDPLLAGLSTEAAMIIDPEYVVLPTANFYFMFVSTFLIAFAGTWVTNKFVEPRLGSYSGSVEADPMEPLTKLEKKALVWTAVLFLVWGLFVFIGLYPDHGFLRSPDNSILHSPVLKGFVTFLFIIAASMGILYGAITGKFKNDKDVMKGMTDSFKTLAAFLVLVFFASQFVAFFKESNLGLVIAVKGAEILQSSEIGMIPLVLLFIILSGFINLFMGSASAKWAILGPVFIPMFMILGYSPELSQAVFRVGDSVTNIISPMMSFFALIIVYFEKYDSKSGIGTIISTMIPYTIIFTILWSLLLVGWTSLNLPLGPGAGIYY